jgi:hypothetical protein
MRRERSRADITPLGGVRFHRIRVPSPRAGIVLVALEANRSNDIVQVVRDAAAFLADPFDGLFTLDSNKAEKAVNWGIAAVVWFALGRLIARFLLRR